MLWIGNQLLAESFDESQSSSGDNYYDEDTNSQNIFRDNPSQLSRKQLYQASSRRSKPTKGNQAHLRLPLLHGQTESSPTRQKIMSRNTRSSRPAIFDENSDPRVEENLPKMDKIPRNAKGASTRRPQEPYEPAQKLSKQAQATKIREEVDAYVVSFKDKDKNKSELVTDIVKLRTDHTIQHRLVQVLKKDICDLQCSMVTLRNANKDLDQQLETMKADHERIRANHEQERSELETKLSQAIADKKKQRTKTSGNVLEKNNELRKKIESQTKSLLWGRIKFIQSHEEEEHACQLLLKIGNFDTSYVDTKQKRADMVETYKTVCKKALFLRRNYATAETKKMIMKRYKENKYVLSLDDLIMCLQRKIKTDADMEKFQIYWVEYLPKFVGSMEWSEKIRYFFTISRAIRKDNKKLPLITPHDEAFGVLCVHNGMARWEKEYKKQLAVAAAAANGEEIVETEEDDVQVDKEGGKFDGLFTKTTQGQNFWGGWTTEGLEKFIEYRAMNMEARDAPGTDQLETDCLNLLRKKVGIQENCEDASEHLKNKEAMKRLLKRGRGDEPLPPKKKIISTHIQDDDLFFSDAEAENED